ncbi:unnamed protein product [Adineta ricciae]|uniref:Uncharacterized protein n=1 Tax=Adineta ricciae TaxID=249248 RepID=A0A814TA28_ADIRI|nr:unnamed protein product [Adineta ricciae]CAF1191596.1 unnamed protein product [Adineta ricciae]
MKLSPKTRKILLLTAFLITVAVCVPATALITYRISTSASGSTQASSKEDIVADFIIIGGGSAGCIVAARLAEYGFETVLISSGANDTLNPMMREKRAYSQLFRMPQFKHYLFPEPSLNLNGRVLNTIVQNTLGGNGVNGGGMEQMMRNDWTYFVNVTNDQSYHHQNMSAYYKMVENFTSTASISPSENHGHSGPIIITQYYDTKFGNVWKSVAQELSETYSDDLAGLSDYGFSFEGSAFTNGLRSWSGDAYLSSTMSKYSNLKVITEATVTKLEINEKTKHVDSVLFVTSNGLFKGTARKEYILSAGVFFSPHLLMLSGIGDSDILRQHNITVKHELKQVGKNLVDNGVVTVEYDTKNFSLGDLKPVGLINSQSTTTNTNPDIFFILKLDEQTKRLTVLILNISPKSPAGYVSLHNSNPLVSPKINLTYLKDERDTKTFVNGIEYIRRIMSTSVMKQYATFNETQPGPNSVNLSTYVINTVSTAQHFLGTCSMGKNEQTSVVDSHFKVHGIDNLRIVDASIFPAGFISKSGPCLTVYALAEKAARTLQQMYS